ncbi:MAG: hypothetical protein WCO56_01640 [Verrucomicrobiota bacterium]
MHGTSTHCFAMALALAGWWCCQAAVMAETNALLRAETLCLICAKPLPPGTNYHHPRGFICGPCYLAGPRCNYCGIPAKDNAVRTTDGRIFCQWDAPELVLTTERAQQVLDETRNELDQRLGSLINLRYTNIHLSLFDVDYRRRNDGSPKPDEMHQLGFSHTRDTGDGLVHNMLLFSGQSRNATAGTCAHELTHLWMHENVPDTRQIEPDTIEAICEVVAYRLMVQRGDTNQAAHIRTNRYTNGRIITLIEAETRHGLRPILDWARTGDEATLPESWTDGTPRATPPTPVPVVIYGTPDPPTFNRLTLQGILGTSQRRIAMINNHSFEKDSEWVLQIDGRDVRVRCLNIEPKTVTLQINEGGKPVTLELP